MMTLEEAIKHYKDVALSCTNKECALEHFQLLKWLQEYSNMLEKQDEQKPVEWSEEDEYTLGETIQHLEELIRIDKAKYCGVDVQYYQRDIDWLKSLKERCTWKPSDRQMASITCAVQKMKESACYDSELVSLYQDLKKLKE